MPILSHQEKTRLEKITPLYSLDFKCTGCNKKPNEIDEYIEAAEDLGMTENEYVLQEEGTYNPSNGHFLCTNCYINAGMPAADVNQGTWVAD